MRTPRRVVLAQVRGGVRATPAYRSAQAAGPVAEAERHSVSGTTPGVDLPAPAFRPAGEQSPGVDEHERVVVDVGDRALGRGLLGQFVRVARGGQAGADVKELA